MKKRLKHILKHNKIKFDLQSITNWATIVGTVATIFFACYTIYLTKELDKTDKKVELLEKLAIKTDTTNQRIFKLINGNQKIQIQNDTMIDELFIQSKLQNEQQILLNENNTTITKQFALSKVKSVIERQKILLDYRNLVDSLRNKVYLKIIFPDKFLEFKQEKKRKIFEDITKTFQEIIANPVVYGTPDNYSKWNTFFTFEFYSFVFSMTNYNITDTVEIYYNGVLITSGKEYLGKVYNEFVEKFKKLENEMYTYPKEWDDIRPY